MSEAWQVNPEITTRMARTEGLEGVAKQAEPTNKAYEIAMVSLGGAILLVIFAVMIMKKFRGSCGTIMITDATENGTCHDQNSSSTISTVDIGGPATIVYVSEPRKMSIEKTAPEVKLSREALLYISLVTCLALPDIPDPPPEYDQL